MSFMKVLILGAGRNQVNAIKKAQEKGHTVIVSDYLPDSPGKKLADYSEMTSTFDIEGNIEVAKKYHVDGVLTIGTDQPVLTAAKVAEALSLPHMISSATALKATHKKNMKEAFVKNNISTSNYRLVKREELENSLELLHKLSPLKFPVVVKPLDNQGQRGVFKINQLDKNIIPYMQETFMLTRDEEIIVEEFGVGDEITISAWVEDYHPYILIITDRPLLNVEPRLGIMTAHHFPSPYTFSHYLELQELVQRTVVGLEIESGPIYLQIIMTPARAELVEIACRIGGGHEEELIPLVTGIDPVDWLIDKSLGKTINIDKLKKYELLNNPAFAQTKFIMAYPGQVKTWGSLEKVKNMKGVVNACFYNPELKEIKEIVDSATSRWGYIIVKGSSKQELDENVLNAYQAVKILDYQNRNLLRITEESTYGYYQWNQLQNDLSESCATSGSQPIDKEKGACDRYL
jgi:phosphoribosylamine-glycine ligase